MATCKEDFAHRLFTIRDLFKNVVVNMALRDDLKKAERLAYDTIDALRRDLKHSLVVAATCLQLRELGWRYARSDHTNSYDIIAWKDDETLIFIECKSYRPPWSSDNTIRELLQAADWKVDKRLVFTFPSKTLQQLEAVHVRDLYEYHGKVYAVQGSIKPLREILKEVEKLRRV